MIESVCKSFNHLKDENHQNNQFTDHHKDQKKDDQNRPEYQIQDKHKKFEEQLALINKIKSLEKSGSKVAEYLKHNIDRNFHMINILIPDDIIISKRPEKEVDIIC